ncbi:C-type lectin [Plakobranchus ocellatus]|uniref:C-type lectin n=1 Tax=Plakobranchus ocellatus TaxID=259542 RepID=A0AAV4CPK3_9GAST|nr:C-type lectin [Plakobranchus ocellatus]
MCLTPVPAWLILGVALVIATAASVPLRDTRKSTILKVIWPAYVNAESPSLRLECSFNRFRTDLVSVNELAIFRSDIGGAAKPEMVATISPTNLTYGLNESDISASGQIQNNAKSSLFVSYTSNTEGYCQTYTCVAKGLKANGEEVSIYRPVKAKGMNNMPCKQAHRARVPGRELGGRSSDCCVASETVQAQSEAIENLENEVEECSAVIPEVKNNGIEINVLRDQINRLSVKLDSNQASGESSGVSPHDTANLESFRRKVDELQNLVHAVSDENRGLRKILSIDVTKYDVSNIANGRVYAASKTEEMQDMRNIERSCDLIGGYVAEIDSVAEQMLLTNFLKMTGNDGYYIGANDMQQEGTFVQFNSRKPASNVQWALGHPKVQGENEDCVQATLSGLKNLECGQPSKFVCEVPVVEENSADNFQSGSGMLAPAPPYERVIESSADNFQSGSGMLAPAPPYERGMLAPAPPYRSVIENSADNFQSGSGMLAPAPPYERVIENNADNFQSGSGMLAPAPTYQKGYRK